MSFVDQFLLKLRVQKLPPVSVVPGNPARVIVKDTRTKTDFPVLTSSFRSSSKLFSDV